MMDVTHWMPLPPAPRDTRAKDEPPCRHGAITSRIETIAGRLVHVQDICRKCGWTSPEFENPGDAVRFYAMRTGLP